MTTISRSGSGCRSADSSALRISRSRLYTGIAIVTAGVLGVVMRGASASVMPRRGQRLKGGPRRRGPEAPVTSRLRGCDSVLLPPFDRIQQASAEVESRRPARAFDQLPIVGTDERRVGRVVGPRAELHSIHPVEEVCD